MAAKQPIPTPRYCVQHNRSTKQDGWRLRDLSLSLNGNIAVTGRNMNTHRTYIDVYTTNVRRSDSRDKPKISYSMEFEKYVSEGTIYRGRLVSFYPGSDTTILSGLGDKLEVIDLIQDRVIKSRKIKLVKHGDLFGEIQCLSVRETEIFIGFRNKSNKINVYDVIDLNEIKSIILQGIQDGYFPCDMTAITDRIFVCVGEFKEESNHKSLIFEEKNGKILSELTKPTDTVHWYVSSVGVNMNTLGIAAVVWFDSFYKREGERFQIVFYSLLSENNCSFLIVEVEFGVYRIRISDRGDRMITGNEWTGEVKVYDMADFITYSSLKENLVSTLQNDDCVRLANYFSLPKDQTDFILKRDRPGETFLHALEEKGVIHSSNVDKLCEAFHELKINPSCYHVTDFYTRTRTQATLYGRFLATLSAHLTASIPEDLCGYFHFPDEKRNSIISSQNPGLSVLLALDERGIIKPLEVKTLEQPFDELRLVQARAKVDEYQIQVEQERADRFKQTTNLSKEEKEKAFIECLQRKIKSWYETMTPVPWKRSCKWKLTELFVGSGLILTDSKTQSKLTDIDPHCKLEYQDVLTHESLLSESRLILEGEPGCGKTMLSSQLAYDWAQNKFKNVKILIFLPLKFVEGMTLVSALRKFYVSDNTPITEEEIEATLNSGDLSTVILLDGLEEYKSPLTQVDGKPSEVHEIMSKQKYPGCKVVLTSRSDYANHLPGCPMLKLGRFGETERNTYIQNVFPYNLEKQQDIKRVIEDSPFILDLCSVPLLFVLAVHNIEGMQLHKGQVDRVTPFMEGMVKTLCSAVYFTSRHEVLSGGSPITELAFNGLCKGFQQLSWQKDFTERNIDDIKEWIDSGVLVVEEGITTVVQDEDITGIQTQEEDMDVGKESIQEKSGPSTLLLEEVTTGGQFQGESLDLSIEPIQEGSVPFTSSSLVQKKYSVMMEGGDDETTAGGRIVMPAMKHQTKTESSRHSEEEKGSKQTSSGTTAKLVPLRLKFLHKVFQEWFAAKYLSSVIWFKGKDYFSNQLTLVDPGDLHYVLRFTCCLCPASCHIILNHLLKSYRDSKGTIPKHIMDCICLCYTEYDGYMEEDIKLVVSKICQENVSIQSQDSRLLQQSKVALLRFASKSGIPIKKVQLLDVVQVAEETRLTLSSDVTLDSLDTLQVIEVSRWDQTLTKEHYSNLVAYIATSKSIHTAYLSFPTQPPVPEPTTLEQVASTNLKVHWEIGQLEHTLDPSKGVWMVHLLAHQSHVQETFPLSVDLDLKSQVSGEMSTLSSLPGASGTPITVPSKQESSKRPTTEVASSTDEVSAVEERTKYSEESSLPERDQDERKAFDQHTTFREAEAKVTRKGGIIEIPNTGVKLYIPANAFEDGMEQCLIQIRIISPFTLNEPDGDFTSNSSATVEILPNKLKLKKNVILTMPHCLELEPDCEYMEDTAKIFLSHHEIGNSPIWEEKPNLRYSLEYRKCSIWLQSFCWVKYLINGEYVKGKKIQVYTASKELSLGDDIVEIEVGYYPDLPGGGELIQLSNKEGTARDNLNTCIGAKLTDYYSPKKILRNSPSLIVSQCKPFIFLKKGKIPLTLELQKVVPGSWTPEQKSEVISFECIASSEERSFPFVFINENKVESFPVFIFWISQGARGIRQTIRPTLKGLDT